MAGLTNEIAKRMGLGGAYPMKPLRWLSRIGIEVDPIRLQNMAIRMSPWVPVSDCAGRAGP